MKLALQGSSMAQLTLQGLLSPYFSYDSMLTATEATYLLTACSKRGPLFCARPIISCTGHATLHSIFQHAHRLQHHRGHSAQHALSVHSGCKSMTAAAHRSCAPYLERKGSDGCSAAW